MTTIAQFGMKEALAQLGIKPINRKDFNRNQWFSSGTILEKSYSPVDGQLIASVKTTSPDDYQKVIQTATEAFKTFRLMPAPRQAKSCGSLAEKIAPKQGSLGQTRFLQQMGKSLQEGYGEVQEMIDICDFAVGLSRQLPGAHYALGTSGTPDVRAIPSVGNSWHHFGLQFSVAVWSWNTALAGFVVMFCVWKPSERNTFYAALPAKTSLPK